MRKYWNISELIIGRNNALEGQFASAQARKRSVHLHLGVCNHVIPLYEALALRFRKLLLKRDFEVLS